MCQQVYNSIARLDIYIEYVMRSVLHGCVGSNLTRGRITNNLRCNNDFVLTVNSVDEPADSFATVRNVSLTYGWKQMLGRYNQTHDKQWSS